MSASTEDDTKSKHWVDMNIVQKDTKVTSTNDVLISYQPPILSDKPIISTFNISRLSHVSVDEVSEIIEFYKCQNCTAYGTTTLMTEDLFKKFVDLEALILTARNKKDGILHGMIISVPCRISIDDRMLQHGCTTFLCVNKKLRKIGLGIRLIQEVSYRGYQMEVFNGYHLVSTPHTGNNIDIKTWYRPIRLETCRSLGFKFAEYKKTGDRGDNRNMLKYRIPHIDPDTIIKVTDSNIKDTFESYTRMSLKYRFRWSPDIKEWSKWSKAFSIYGVKESGWMILRGEKVKLNGEADICVVMMMIGVYSKMLAAALHEENSLKYDVLYGYMTSDLKESDLSGVNAQITTGPLQFEMYNTAINLDDSDLCVPIL